MNTTADMITDDQIRQLKRAMLGHPNKTKFHRDAISACNVALTDRRAMAFQMAGVREGVERARARCAEIWNEMSRRVAEKHER